MTRNETRYYRASRVIWEQPAQTALRMAKSYAKCKELGVTFDWAAEDETPESVFGKASFYHCSNCGRTFYTKGDCPGCNEPRVTFTDTGCFYDPTAEFYYCQVNFKGEVLASLGMIDDARNRSDLRGYWFQVECELATEAIDRAELLAEVDTVEEGF
jgi:hypothetical protein